MVFPILPILGGLGSLFSGGAGSDSTTTSNFDSTTTGTGEINRTELPPEVLSALQKLFTGGQLQTNQNEVQGALTGSLGAVAQDQSKPFDIASFVNGITKAATNTATNDLNKNLNETEAGIGGTQGTNSMAALLGERLKTDAAAQVAGVTSNATAQGQQIAQNQLTGDVTSTIGLTSAMTKNITDLLTLFRGASTDQTQKTSEHTVGTSTSSTSQPFNWMSGIGGLLTGLTKKPET